MYIENYKTASRETKERVNKCGDTPCSWIGRFKIIKIMLSQIDHDDPNIDSRQSQPKS